MSGVTTPEILLRSALIGEWVLGIAAGGIGAWELSLFDSEVVRAVEASQPSGFVDVLAACLLLLHLVASVAVFARWPWGRALYLTSLVGALCVTPFYGPSLSGPIEGTLSFAATMLSGCVAGTLLLRPSE